jgi:negative regulator of flagellin synthesis FlgM
MVDPINTSNAARMRLQTVQTDGTAGAPGAAQQGQPVSAVDQVHLSDTASTRITERLAENGPPFDAARVSRIREALAEGQYPVDPQRITDSIFQDYSALMR